MKEEEEGVVKDVEGEEAGGGSQTLSSLHQSFQWEWDLLKNKDLGLQFQVMVYQEEETVFLVQK